MGERTRVSGHEYSALQTWFACMTMVEECGKILGARAKNAAPGTFRDIRMLPGKMQGVMDNLLRTVDEKKLAQIMQDLRHVRMYVRVEAPGIRTLPDRQFSYLDTRVLNDLLNYLIQSECLTCDKTPAEARKCPHRKLIEDALPHEIDARDTDHCKYSDLVLGIQEVTA